MNAQSDNRRLVEQFWGALDDGPPRGSALEAWKEFFAQDAVWEMPFAPEPLVQAVPGGDLIGHFVDWFFESVPDLRIDSLTVHDTADPELFILELHGTATVTQTGKIYENTYCTHMRVRDGQIVLLREYFNPEVVVEAFGRDEIAKGMSTVMAAAGVEVAQ